MSVEKGKGGFWIVGVKWMENGENKFIQFGLKDIDGSWKIERGYYW